MRAISIALTVSLAVAVSGCRSKDPHASSTSHPSSLELVKQTAPADALDRVTARLPPRTGNCAQVKSVNEREKADAVADEIRKGTSLPVEIVKADLGDRGTWFRLCVGDEDSEAKLVAKATHWTSPGGELEPWLDKSTDNAPRFFVLQRATAEERRATEPQAKALFQTRIVDGAPVLLFGGHEAPLVASTAATQTGASDVVAVDAKGNALGFDDKAAPGCASCELAFKDAPVRARRAIGAADFVVAPGDELLVEEETAKGVRIASVVAASGGALHRVASLVIENAKPGFLSKAQVSAIDADADAQKEIAVETSEVTVENDVACALSKRAAIYDVDAAKGLVRIDPLKLPVNPPEAIIDVVTALDAAGDHDLASKTCAAQLARNSSAQLAQLCLQRVRRLRDGNALVDAVNAAGLLSDEVPTARPLVSAAFLDAVHALDKAMQVDPPACNLVEHVAGKPIDDVLRAAAEKASQRVELADVADAVLVTGARDFGPDSPVGAITMRWLDEAKTALPARYAAVEAALLPAPGDAQVGADGAEKKP